MPAKRTTGGITAAEVDEKLPRTFFVTRGHLQHAFGFSKEEIGTLVDQGVFGVEYPFGKTRKVKKKKQEKIVKSRMKFLRSRAISVARRWETAG